MRMKYPTEKLEGVGLLYSDNWNIMLVPITEAMVENIDLALDISRVGLYSKTIGTVSLDEIATLIHFEQRFAFAWISNPSLDNILS